MDCLKRECALGKGRVWAGQRENMDYVKGEYGLGKARVWIV